ncbi:glycosyltransferase [Candidatus Pelagibacter sp.]|mgnify:CR=1 FL=1|nr:glycosyltransferase [Candidatus Pelagibacter sp.]|tara:strand:- start:513 stop:1403 length:891 start_codon:yes stop_codon:yes gene_type:complete
MFSILIPTFNNIKYLELCVNSIKKNSIYDHQIVAHVNIGDDGTIDYLNKNKIEFTHTKYNSGICEGINRAAKLAKFDYFLYAHDDFYFCPNWDDILKKEIENLGHNNFYLSGTMMHNGQIKFECGDFIDNFNEKKFLEEYKNYNYYDFQGSTWAPSLVHRHIWNKVGGFSEEYFPGTGSDPDFNMKLWNLGVRVFKGINDFKVYHFGSIVLRKKVNKISKKKYGSIGGKIFLIKWGITIKFFKKFYLRSNTKYQNPLSDPIKSTNYYLNLIKCKLNYYYVKLIYRKINKTYFKRHI